MSDNIDWTTIPTIKPSAENNLYVLKIDSCPEGISILPEESGIGLIGTSAYTAHKGGVIFKFGNVCMVIAPSYEKNTDVGTALLALETVDKLKTNDSKFSFHTFITHHETA